MNLSLSNQAIPLDDVLFQEVGDEAVLLSLGREQYFGLDPVGTRIWKLLGEDTRLQTAFDQLRDLYDVEPSRLETDLLELVSRLATAGLVRVS
jgi:hypothetical protein